MFETRRKLLLLSMDWTRPKDPPLSLGQASIIANLNRHKVPVISKAWSVSVPSFDYREIFDYAMFYSASDVDLALGAYVWHEPHTQKLLNDLKEAEFPGRIILGGPQVSYTKKNIEYFYPQVDIFIRGYAEEALAQLMTSDEKICGVHRVGGEDLGESAEINLDSLPSPFLTGVISPQPFIRWETQRGCPYKCAFCQHRESDSSKKRRQFPPSRIIQEIDWIIKNPIISDIAVLDPTFNSGSYYLEILKALIERKYRGKLALQCRAETISSEFLSLIENLNKTAHVVLEFGLQTIHKEEMRIIQRPNGIRRIKKVFSEIKERKISSEISLIFGLPKQTVESFQSSIDFCKNLDIPVIHAFPLMLLRGTPLFEMKEKLGLIEGMNMGINIDRIQENIPHVISSPSFNTEEWRLMAKMAESLDEYNQR